MTIEESWSRRAKTSLSSSSRFSQMVCTKVTLLDLLEEEYGIDRKWVSIDQYYHIFLKLPKWYDDINIVNKIQERCQTISNISLEFV